MKKYLLSMICLFLLVTQGVCGMTSVASAAVEGEAFSRLTGIWKDTGPGYANYYQLFTSGYNQVSIKFSYAKFDDSRRVSNTESITYNLTVQGLTISGQSTEHYRFPEAGKYPPPQKFTVRGHISEDGNRITLVSRGPKFQYPAFAFTGPIEENIIVLKRD